MVASRSRASSPRMWALSISRAASETIETGSYPPAFPTDKAPCEGPGPDGYVITVFPCRLTDAGSAAAAPCATQASPGGRLRVNHRPGGRRPLEIAYHPRRAAVSCSRLLAGTWLLALRASASVLLV